MDWVHLKQRLSREARDYLADLREIRDDLRSKEGWIALALVIAAVLMAGAWVLFSLGFNPASDTITPTCASSASTRAGQSATSAASFFSSTWSCWCS